MKHYLQKHITQYMCYLVIWLCGTEMTERADNEFYSKSLTYPD